MTVGTHRGDHELPRRARRNRNGARRRSDAVPGARWNALAQFPYGTTGTYGLAARAVGAPRAAPAVGAANGRNPVSLLVPCHRIIGAGGRLTGYAGGMERKEYLLRLEGALL